MSCYVRQWFPLCVWMMLRRCSLFLIMSSMRWCLIWHCCLQFVYVLLLADGHQRRPV